MFVSYIIVHTVDVFGVEVEHVGYIIDSGYKVGGGWASNFFVVRIPILLAIIRPGLLSVSKPADLG